MVAPLQQAAGHQPGYRLSVQFRIRYADIDAQHHLNNVAYFTYMEHARLEYLRDVGLWDGRRFEDVGMILAEATCSYLAPAYLGETVTVWLRVGYLGRKSFHFEYLLETEQGTIASGRSVQVCYDYDELRTREIPRAWREAIQAYEPAL